jgi:hypothetical protein
MTFDAVAMQGEAYLEHFGKKGMKWGVRKDDSSGGSSTPRKKMSPNTKVAIGATIALGATTAAFLMSKHRAVKMRQISMLARTERAAMSVSPSPFQMRMEAGMAAHRNAMLRVGNQRLTDKTWRDAARMSQMKRARFSAKGKSVTDMSDLTAKLMNFNDEALRRGGMK